MNLAPGGCFQAMANQMEDQGQALFSAAQATGQIDDQSRPLEAGNSAGKPGVGIMGGTQGTYGLSNSGGFPVDDAPGSLRSAVPWPESGSSDGQHQCRAGITELFKFLGDGVFVVRQCAGKDFGLLPLLFEYPDYGRACCVLKQALGTTVGDGKNGQTHEQNCRG